jgi:hypothetical protein
MPQSSHLHGQFTSFQGQPAKVHVPRAQASPRRRALVGERTVNAAIVSIAAERLLDYCTGKLRLVNVPEGSTMGAWWRDETRAGHALLRMRVEHPSLPEVRDGARVPLLRGRFLRV